MYAIDIESFTPIDAFKERVDNLIKSIKSTPTAPGFDEILIPGEPEFRTMEERSRKGIEVADATWEALQKLAKDVGVIIE
jgi:LDH2 family malate/lactate/ureidoglycolate dehydrogenase